jgi:hypothetical protein
MYAKSSSLKFAKPCVAPLGLKHIFSFTQGSRPGLDCSTPSALGRPYATFLRQYNYRVVDALEAMSFQTRSAGQKT